MNCKFAVEREDHSSNTEPGPEDVKVEVKSEDEEQTDYIDIKHETFPTFEEAEPETKTQEHIFKLCTAATTLPRTGEQLRKLPGTLEPLQVKESEHVPDSQQEIVLMDFPLSCKDEFTCHPCEAVPSTSTVGVTWDKYNHEMLRTPKHPSLGVTKRQSPNTQN
ncbi:hypothetical protein L9F63_017954, partial [Diploptera punctata]